MVMSPILTPMTDIVDPLVTTDVIKGYSHVLRSPARRARLTLCFGVDQWHDLVSLSYPSL